MALYSIINNELINNINKLNTYCITRLCCTIHKILFFDEKSLLFFPENYSFFEQSLLQIMR